VATARCLFASLILRGKQGRAFCTSDLGSCQERLQILLVLTEVVVSELLCWTTVIERRDKRFGGWRHGVFMTGREPIGNNDSQETI
jgi:hypothetical protein